MNCWLLTHIIAGDSKCDFNDKSYFLRVELALLPYRQDLKRDVRRVSRYKSVFFSFYPVICWAVLVLESSQHGISTLTYFSQNSEQTGNFFANKFTKQTLQIGLD